MFSRHFVDFINEDGLYAIGDKLYQITENSIKMMEPADLYNTELIINASKEDSANNIYITSKESLLKSTTDSPGLIESAWVEEGTGKSGDRRIKIGLLLEVDLYNTGNHNFYFYHDVYVQCQERNWLRIWKYKFTSMSVSGEWEMGVYKWPEVYSSDYSYSGSVSDFKSSVNPGDGSTGPFQTTWIVSPWNLWNINYTDYHHPDYAPYFYSYDWSATRSDANLTATLVK